MHKIPNCRSMALLFYRTRGPRHDRHHVPRLQPPSLSYSLSVIAKIPPHFQNHKQTYQVTVGLGASDRRSICSSGTSCVASSVIVSVAVAAAPAFAAPPPPPEEEEAAPAAAGGCPPDGAEARSVRDVTEPCRPWPALLLLPSILSSRVGCLLLLAGCLKK